MPVIKDANILGYVIGHKCFHRGHIDNFDLDIDDFDMDAIDASYLITNEHIDIGDRYYCDKCGKEIY